MLQLEAVTEPGRLVVRDRLSLVRGRIELRQTPTAIVRLLHVTGLLPQVVLVENTPAGDGERA